MVFLGVVVLLLFFLWFGLVLLCHGLENSSIVSRILLVFLLVFMCLL